MKRLLLAGVCLAILAGCDARSNSEENSANISTEVEMAAPELGAFGIDFTAMKETVRPQDDFYRYVNGTWLDTFEIPEDRSNYGSFTRLAELSEKRTRSIIEGAAENPGAAGSEAAKIGALYKSFMDEERANALGLEPIRADLDAIAALDSLEGVAKVMAKMTVEGGTSPINFFVNQDSKNPDVYITYFTQTGLGLPDRDYYLEDNERFNDIRAKYIAYITAILTEAGVDGAAEKADAIMALETKMAEVFWTRTESRDRDKTYNKLSREDLVAANSNFPWDAYLQDVGLADEQSFIVRQPSSLKGVTDIFADTSIDDWKAYLTFHQLDGAAPLLSQNFVDLAFDFNSKTLFGVPKNRDRWKRGVSFVEGALGEAVGKLYVEKYFAPEAKEAMDELVANLITAFDVSIKELDWMGDETKEQALVKLSKFTPKIGYPSKWRDYSALEVKEGDLVGNSRRANTFEYWRNIKKLGAPVDRTEWFMTPQTVNAYYNPPANEIVFPAAILQPPFFDVNADPAVNYGGIGAVIGHEIGHGFDDQGSKSDGDGILRNWWTDADLEGFKARTDALVAQYDAFEPLPGEHVNGRLTLGENIGDLGGLTIAYEAYKLSLGGKEAPVIDGYTGDQRFFMSWAQVWRRLYREETLSNRLKTDPHSPSEQRTNGIVRNIDAWYDAFGVGEEDEMYLPPEERVSIW
ncbi:MAG: M13-type metalloendopeptidase [Sphingomonadales bacterium]|jgi:predicted metalloendopeptidase